MSGIIKQLKTATANPLGGGQLAMSIITAPAVRRFS